MFIEKLELKNYRNYEELDINLSNDVNIFFGDNAQGKTNILESIYLCATASSHRGSKDKDIIRFDNDEAHIKLFTKKREMSYRIDMHLKKNKAKGIAVNGVPVKRISEIFGILNVILFSPEDLSIIKDGPSKRRKFLDVELCQIDKIYLNNLINYNKILNQRNKVLKDYGRVNNVDTMLDVLDEQLITYSKEIIKRRKLFIRELNGIVFDIHSRISDNREKINIVYKPNIDEKIEDMYLMNRDTDKRYRTTSIGPHRDDMVFMNDKEDIRVYGSQGQQRTVALSLKLAEIELVKNRINDNPILLLDDVLSELDDKRQSHLIDSLKDVQTLITCTGVNDFINKQTGKNKIFKVINGTVDERSFNE